MFWGKDIETKEEPAVREFVRYFHEQVFTVYCQKERGILRSRLNRFKDGCEAYYVQWRGKNAQRQVEDAAAEEQEQETVSI